MNFDNAEYGKMQEIVNRFNTHFTKLGDSYVIKTRNFKQIN